MLKVDSRVTFNQHVVFKVRDVTVYLLYRSPNAPTKAMAGLAGLIQGADSNSIFIGGFNLPDVRVADPDPVRSGPFCRIRIRSRIRKFSTGSGSGSFPSYIKLYNTIICKLSFFQIFKFHDRRTHLNYKSF